MPSRRLTAARADVLLAAVALVEFSLELALVVPDGTPHRAAAFACAVGSAASFAVRRRAPLVTMACTYFAMLGLTLLSPAYPEHVAGPHFATFFAGFALGSHAGRRALAAGVTIGIAVQGLGQLLTPSDAGDYLFGLSIGVAAPVLSAVCCAPAPRSTARCARRPRRSSARAPARRSARWPTSAPGSPASCTTSSRTR